MKVATQLLKSKILYTHSTSILNIWVIKDPSQALPILDNNKLLAPSQNAGLNMQ